jgi:hypothetical protein
MSQENVVLVRREYGALAARDWTTIAEIWHSGIELEAVEATPGRDIYPAAEEITQFLDSLAGPHSRGKPALCR